MKYTVLILICLVTITNVFSQEFSKKLTDVIPPSPNASAIGKYGEIPVSYNIGSPTIGIPLYEVNIPGIQVPISLNYHASGVRVEDKASWVGLGWSLSAGGAITRSVRGTADDASNGLRNNNLPAESVINDATQTDNLGQYFGPQASPDGVGVKDREPDLFYYNFMGASGKLYFDENNVVVSKPYNNLKIEPIFFGGELDRWIITDQNGIKYYFGADNNTISGLGKERTAPGDQPSFTSAWYLVEVHNPKTDRKVYFEYDDLTSKVEKPKNQSLEWYFFQNVFALPFFDAINTRQTNPKFESPSSAKTTIYGNRTLRKILFTDGSVQFTTTSNRTDIEDEVELSKIEIFNKSSQLLKSYQFDYDFIGRLFLNGIDEYDKLTQEKKPYVFEYHPDIPTGAIYDQDFWGFYNSAGNTSLIPSIYSVNNPYGQYQADRLPNESAMKRGTIKKITYPTKGSTEYYFEAHKAFTPQNTDPYTPFLLNSQTDVNLTSAQGEYKEVLFSIETENPQNILFDIDFTYFREEHNTNRPAAYLEKFENGSWNEVRPPWWPSYPSLADESFDTSIELLPGDYRFFLTDVPCASPPCYVAQPDELEKRFVTYGKFSYLQGSTTDFKNKEITVGGLRIQKIINRDHNGAIIDQKRYSYEDGKIITFPVHNSYYEQDMHTNGYYNSQLACWIATELDDYRIYTVSSNSLAVLGASQGSHVIYSRVTEEKIDVNNANNGSMVYEYYVPDALDIPGNNSSVPPFVPHEDISDIANKLKKKLYKDSNGDIIKSIEYNYSFISPEIPTYPVKGLSIHKKRQRVVLNLSQSLCSLIDVYAAPQSHFFHYAFYNVETSWIKLNSVITTDFDGQNPVITTASYFYDNTTHLLPTRTETTNSNGKIVSIKTYYPDDVTNTSSLGSTDLLNPDEYDAIDALKTNVLHRIAEPIQIETTIDGGKTIQRTNYKVWHNIGLTLPEYLQTNKGSNTLENRLHYHRYNEKGNPLEASSADGISITYIWGYNKMYPVAKIENASYADIENLSGFGSNFDLGENGLSGSQEITLRSQLPNAMITTYVYEPLIGIKSVTDPRGYITKYTYDDFNRLKEVRDQDDNLLTDYQYHYKN